MAFVKKPLQDGVKTKLKDYSVDLEGRIGDLTKPSSKIQITALSPVIKDWLWVRNIGGKIVELNGLIYNNSGSKINAETNLFTIPSGYRPTTAIYTAMRYGGGATGVVIRTDGNVRNSSAFDTGTFLGIHVVYFLD